LLIDLGDDRRIQKSWHLNVTVTLEAFTQFLRITVVHITVVNVSEFCNGKTFCEQTDRLLVGGLCRMFYTNFMRCVRMLQSKGASLRGASRLGGGGDEICASISSMQHLIAMQCPVFQELDLVRYGNSSEVLCRCRWRAPMKEKKASCILQLARCFVTAGQVPEATKCNNSRC
jgi:hypothetical protein